ncbi:uncharacterized protein KY384_002047 [Bacidia gigantensis]|uniref:uncharacterized protein n=1 Tax=Bacidia gigantensis TaxID=2732470 RepID=UPI001D03679B|nr:uncharacterized protein KY384_002047 [Bacidia gigantensis]KAG8533264.1 hypothetical protein KY384_002047 [Bacidia gigantensis]
MSSQEIHDTTAAGTAEENIPTQSNPMDNIHGNTEDISNKASGYKWGRQGVMNSDKYPEKTKQNAAEKFEALGGEQAFMDNNKKGE